jgi:hypothetical protein
MAKFYTLDEAAKALGVSTGEARKLLQKENVREYNDPARKTFNYPAPAVDEVVRRIGHGSEPELQLGEQPKAKRADSPVQKRPIVEDSDEVELGKAGAGEKPSSKKGGAKSPAPKAGSDSDVRLVAEGSDLEFQVASDSGAQLVSEPGGPKSGAKHTKTKKPSDPDSGVRLVPQEPKSDSDVKLVSDSKSDEMPAQVELGKSPSDSDIRLQPGQGDSGPGSDSSLLTEEIDLDAELKKADVSGKSKRPKSKAVLKGKGGEAAKESPFELSESDIDVTKPAVKAKKKEESSSDVDLTPHRASDSSPLEPESDELSLGELTAGQGDSGINLQDPADGGISLEKKKKKASDSSDEMDLGTKKDGPTTPKPTAKPKKKEESSSEFELSLEGEGKSDSDISSDSEFELSLDVEGEAKSDSDSEFELTLDDSGGLAPIEDEPKSDKDIFETEFEVPALEDESGSQAVALNEDTDLESSDFDLALGDEEEASEDEESGSQVVALEDEEEADDAAETVQRRRGRGAGAAAGLEAEEEVDEILHGDEEVGEEEEEEAAAVGTARGAPAEPAVWGPLPAIALIPCVIVMFLVTLVGYEMVKGMWGFHRGTGVSSAIARPLAELMGQDLPKEK